MTIETGNTQEYFELGRRYAFKRQCLEMIHERRQEELDRDFLVDPRHAELYPSEAEQLKQDFLEKKKGLNIGECFELAVSPEFLGKVCVTRLAETDHSEKDASLKMFKEMKDFMYWAKTKGPLSHVAELPLDDATYSDDIGSDDDENPEDGDFENVVDRLRSSRWMTYEYVGDHVLITRIRPFVSTETTINNVRYTMHLYKETNIALSKPFFEDVHFHQKSVIQHGLDAMYPRASEGPDGPISNNEMKHIERWMYTESGKDIVTRIDTAIFLVMEPADAVVDTV